MAELLGLVASVIQVAGAGVQLSKTLYEYVDGVATADRRIKDIATEIKMTSIVIEELGDVFQHEETASLVSKKAVQTANDTITECSVLFGQIDATLKKSKKNSFGRLIVPFRDTKLELLRSHVDKLKSTLQLLMQVLTHAYQVASRRLDRAAEARQREEIKKLLDKKDESIKIHKELLRKDSASNSSTLLDNDEGGGTEDERVGPDLVTSASTFGSTLTTQGLAACVDHVRNLLRDIETLQQALSSAAPGDDHSNHHQSLVDSYFRTRGCLDLIVLGSSKGGAAPDLRVQKSDVTRIELPRPISPGYAATSPQYSPTSPAYGSATSPSYSLTSSNHDTSIQDPDASSVHDSQNASRVSLVPSLQQQRLHEQQLKGKGQFAEETQDDMVALKLQLNMAEQEKERLKKENDTLRSQSRGALNPTIPRGSSLNISQDILARLQAVRLGRQGSPQVASMEQNPDLPQSSATSTDAQGKPCPRLADGVPANFRMPGGKQPMPSFASAPTILGRAGGPAPKLSLAERRSAPKLGGLPGAGTPALTVRKRPGMTLSAPMQNDSVGSSTTLDKYSDSLDNPCGALTFGSKTVHTPGRQTSIQNDDEGEQIGQLFDPLYEIDWSKDSVDGQVPMRKVYKEVDCLLRDWTVILDGDDQEC